MNKSQLIDNLPSVFGCLKFKTIVGKNGQATYNGHKALLIPETYSKGDKSIISGRDAR